MAKEFWTHLGRHRRQRKKHESTNHSISEAEGSFKRMILAQAPHFPGRKAGPKRGGDGVGATGTCDITLELPLHQEEAGKAWETPPEIP